MAYRKKVTKKAYKKRAYKKKAYKKAVIPRTMVSTGMGFPKKLCMTHKYVETFTLGHASGGFNHYIFSANSMYDPNVSGTGHQPMYWDQIMALYNHAVVIGSKCVFKAVPTTQQNTMIRTAAFIEDGATLAVSGLDSVVEQSLAKSTRFFTPNNSNFVTSTLKWSAKKFFGKGVLANSNLRQSASASPTEQSYFVIAVQGNGVISYDITVTVEITYCTVYFELKDIAGS